MLTILNCRNIVPVSVLRILCFQAVVSTHQIVANGYVNGTAVAVAPTAYLAATPTVVHTSSPHGYHPYQQVRQVNFSTLIELEHFSLAADVVTHENFEVVAWV